ncbi:hypothetical protein QY049_20605 [Bradyrhizobium sp. WYCCWR 13022]|uniref:hypothetical protein n=1 Tax=unclassified Bradyrhizobium TaxID=2631580 RepID=UPI00263B4974|nr:hypothetical protein [Bradyrhizobium sp. WYCCWR 13022]MDN4985566.1 hypothetical protein [Bradyrhizobium sp. WYCCWR 13022]
MSKEATKLPSLPPARRSRPTPAAGRRNDLARRAVAAALQASGRYKVIANLRIPVTEQARHAVARARGGYVGLSLPVEGPCETVVVDMVVLDERSSWAGAYAFCHQGAQSPMARRRVEEDLRAAELVLRAHLARLVHLDFRTVVVGIIDQSADPEQVDDLTIPASEISDHFEIDFPGPGEMYRTCPDSGA